jgi:16S rRNA (cytosine1402-N4)-methyltransferase
MIAQKAEKSSTHTPVLVSEVVQYLDPKPGQVYIDATFGAGGHTRALLEQQAGCSVIALDWDLHSIEQYSPLLREQYGDRFRVIWGNFASLYAIVRKENITAVHGVLADFGTSHMQLADRAGFSFNRDTLLDMRMSPAHQPVTAAQVVNTASQEKLAQIFLQLGGGAICAYHSTCNRSTASNKKNHYNERIS